MTRRNKRNQNAGAQRPAASAKEIRRAVHLELVGNGDYKSVFRKAAGTARRVGRALPQGAVARVAQAAAREVVRSGGGSVMAKGARGLAKAFLGSGDYKSTPEPHSNSLIDGVGPTGPSVFNATRREVRIRESEYIGDVLSGSMLAASSAFTNQSYVVNPSDPVTFPWLCRIAPLFDQWVPYGIVFEFRSTSSEFNGTSQALGVVVGALDYDNADPQYATRQEMENSDYAVSCKASSSLYMGVECDPDERPTKVLFTGPAPAGASDVSLNMYNLASAQIATQGMSAASVTVGELWVHYDIGFLKKQVRPPGSDGLSYSMFVHAAIPSPPEYPYLVCKSPSTVVDVRNNFPGCTLDSSGYFHFPEKFRGRVMVAMFIMEVGVDAVGLTMLPVSGGSGWVDVGSEIVGNDVNEEVDIVTAGTAGFCQAFAVLHIEEDNASVGIGGITYTTAVAAQQLNIQVAVFPVPNGPDFFN